MMKTWLTLFFLASRLTAGGDCPSRQEYKETQPVEMLWTSTEEDGLIISLQTKRLLIRSILPKDLPSYCALFAHPDVMKLYAQGTTRSPEETAQRFQNSWRARWLAGDPFSAMAVTLIDLNKTPLDYPVIGHVVMGHGAYLGQSELAFLFFPEYWEKGYAKEAVFAVVKTLGRELANRGYGPRDEPFMEIVASCWSDNVRSLQILKELGMRQADQKRGYDHDRLFFSLSVRELP